jgi:hypothetical protein
MRKEVAASRAHADRLSLVAKELKKAGQAFLDKKKTDFIERVSSFLPEGEAFDVDLGSARMGFDRDGQLHSALSGAEESRMLLALASSQEDGSTPCVLIPKDRGWDRDTLGHVMAALADSPVQVVIMSTVEPDPVEGWTLVSRKPSCGNGRCPRPPALQQYEGSVASEPLGYRVDAHSDRRAQVALRNGGH